MNKLLRIMTSIALTFLFVIICNYLPVFGLNIQDYISDRIYVITVITLPIALYFTLSVPFAKLFAHVVKQIEKKLILRPAKELLFGILGSGFGLFAAFIIIKSISFAQYLNEIIGVLLLSLFAIIGWRVAAAKAHELDLPWDKSSSVCGGRPKILDTSVIIDGRILDILGTGFIEGKIIIPTFILEELRHIADSSDALKRNRGRLGLDVLNQIQQLDGVDVEIIDWTTEDGSQPEVDILLIKMARAINGFVITNDLNLNKVAELQKVPVLNINELSNAVKSVVLPGQEMVVFVVKEGKEINQGVAYLNDGTMIVIEDGKKFIDKNVEIVVTSVLQTPAGRMIFGKFKDNQMV